MSKENKSEKRVVRSSEIAEIMEIKPQSYMIGQPITDKKKNAHIEMIRRTFEGGLK